MRNTVIALLSCCALACASGPQPKPLTGGAPAWSGFKSGPCPKVDGAELPHPGLCAVGVAESIESYSLGLETASTRARAEMAAVMQSKVDGFTRATQDSLSRMGHADETQKVASMAQNLVERTLNGVTIPLVFFDKDDHIFFAMAAVDAQTFASAVKGLSDSKGLSDAAKAEVQTRAQSVVDDWQSERDRAAQ